MTRALVMVAILHYLRLSFGNSLYARMVENTYGPPEVIGGIIRTEDGSPFTMGPTARPWTGCSNDSVNVLVDSGASGHYSGDAIMSGFRDRLEDYKVLDVPQKNSTAGGFRVERLKVDESPGLLRSDGGADRVHQHQHAVANRHVRTRWKYSCSYGAVYACRQRTAKVSVGRNDVHGVVSWQQGATL